MLNPVERVLVVTAHPDDVDFGAAGTVAGWTDAGTEVTYCVCTDGQAGGFDMEVARERVPAIRRAEQVAAAEVVGVHDVRFLGHLDGELEVTRDLVRDLVRVIRQVRPQRVLTQSPERWWELLAASHPDHLATGEAAVRAVYPFARNPFAFPELLRDEALAEWSVAELWLMADPQPNRHVDVTAAFPRKMRAILSHESQTPDRDRIEPRMRELLSEGARHAGLAPGRLAESFRVAATS